MSVAAKSAIYFEHCQRGLHLSSRSLSGCSVYLLGEVASGAGRSCEQPSGNGICDYERGIGFLSGGSFPKTPQKLWDANAGRLLAASGWCADPRRFEQMRGEAVLQCVWMYFF